MPNITKIVSVASAAIVLFTGLFAPCSDEAWARGGGGRGGGSRGGRVSVRGYYRSNGTYVSPHSRSSPGGGFSGYSSGYGSGSLGSLFSTYMNWGYEDTKRKSYDSALIWFEAALREKPNNPYALKAVNNLKKYVRSSLAYSFATTDNFESCMKMGYSYTGIKQYGLALHWFELALNERPGNPYATKAIQNVQRYVRARAQ